MPQMRDEAFPERRLGETPQNTWEAGPFQEANAAEDAGEDGEVLVRVRCLWETVDDEGISGEASGGAW